VELNFDIFGPFKKFLSGKIFEGKNLMGGDKKEKVVQNFTFLGMKHHREGIVGTTT
jgi:hypothetical protein